MEGDIISDDDDLPTTFLSTLIRPVSNKDNIATPEKISTPAGNNMSPITPLEQRKRRKRAMKFSVKKLLSEKTSKQDHDEKITKMDEELKAQIMQGGILDLIQKKPCDESQDFGEISQTEDSQGEGLLPQHQKELEEATEGFLNDFPDGFPGEQIFIYKSQSVELCIPDVLKDLLDSPNEEHRGTIPMDSVIQSTLTSGFLVDLVTFKDINDSVIDWLISCICQSSDYQILEGALKAFWAIITIKSKANRQPIWQFSTSMFLNHLIQMGASIQTLFGQSNVKEDFPDLIKPIESEMESHATRERKDDEVNCDTMFALRLQTLLKCYSCCLKQFPDWYKHDDVTLTVAVALKLCISLEIIVASWDIQVLIGCAIDCYKDEEWKDAVDAICNIAVGLNNNHSNRLQMVEAIPITARGRELKRFLALKFISIECSGVDSSSKLSQVAKVLQAMNSIHINQDTDYHHLFSVISLTSHCLPDHAIVASDKKNLEEFIAALRRLNGEIKDPGGRFMNRTKVKDLIVRVISRLTYVSRGLKTQSSLDRFFTDSKSSFDQLHFETLQDEPAKAELQDETENANEALKEASSDSSSLASSPASLADSEDDGLIRLNEDPLLDLGLPGMD
eukprot:gene5516-6201_t